MTELRCRNCGASIERIVPGSTTPNHFRHKNKAVACDLDDIGSLTAEPK